MEEMISENLKNLMPPVLLTGTKLDEGLEVNLQENMLSNLTNIKKIAKNNKIEPILPFVQLDKVLGFEIFPVLIG